MEFAFSQCDPTSDQNDESFWTPQAYTFFILSVANF